MDEDKDKPVVSGEATAPVYETDDITNDSAYMGPRQDPDVVASGKKLKAETLSALPVIRKVIKQLDEDIAFYGSVDSIPPEVKVQPEQFMIMHNSNEMTRDALRKKRDWLQSLVEDYAAHKS